MPEDENKEGQPVEGADNADNDGGADNTSNDDIEALKKQLQDKEAELEKLRNKDISFNKVKKMTEEEKQKHDNEKKTLQEQMDSIKEELDSEKKSRISEIYDITVRSIVGDDEEKLKAIREEYNILNMPDGNREEIVQRTKKAMKLAGFEPSGDLSTLSFGGSRESIKTEKKFHQTDRGKAVVGLFAPDLVKKDNE
jgi:hypothetical protein